VETQGRWGRRLLGRAGGGGLRGVWLAVVCVLAVALVLGALTPVLAGAVLRSALGSQFDTSDVRVHVDAWPPLALWAGRIDVLTVTALHPRLGTLVADRFDATLDGVQLDAGALYARHTFVIRRLGSGVARVTVSQEAIRGLLAAQPSLHDVSVALESGRIAVDATLSMLGAPVRAAGEGRLVLHDGTTADFVFDQFTVAGVPLPPLVGDQVARSINPVVDVRLLPLHVRLTGVQVADGTATLDAIIVPQ
jgi:hypothetical protein